jgi:hypothetical protein
MPDADANLLRALICANAYIPEACVELFPHPKEEKKISKETAGGVRIWLKSTSTACHALLRTTLLSGQERESSTSAITSMRFQFPEDLLNPGGEFENYL